jgi:PAS domain S-box-containing protein
MISMDKMLRVLHVEDSEQDMALIARHLKRAGYDLISDRVETLDSMKAALESQEWNVILCDYSMPHFNALAALALVKEMKLDVPFIIISGTIGESSAVEAMRAGAHDYMMKDALTRLAPAIEREINEAENRLARREAEDQLRLQSAALESAANAIMITNEKGEIIWINPAFTETTGYSSVDAVGRNPRFLKSGKQDQAFYQGMWETILAGRVWRNTVINRRKDGNLNTEDLTITPIRNQAGKITHFVAIKQDITQLQQALSELQQKSDELAAMTQQLWHASKLTTMGELSASIAHELNNPLATVALRVENLLMQIPADDQQRRSLEIITQEVDRMAGLVENLLQFSRRSHRQVSTVDLREEIVNSVEFVHYYLRTRKIEVVREFADPLPTIQADRQQVRQLFLNLLTNASDAMPQGGKLFVRAEATWLEGAAAVALEFEDTGEGITAEHLAKIWEPFFTTKPEGKGTGLGLAICRRIVEEHGGAIEIKSETGRGATVRMTFPATANGAAANLL